MSRVIDFAADPEYRIDTLLKQSFPWCWQFMALFTAFYGAILILIGLPQF